MKKKLFVIVPIFAAAFALILQGCKKPGTEPKDEGEYTITVSDPTLQLDVLDREDITATVKNPAGEVADSQVAWTSSDTSVVTVSNGTIDALKAGTATITAAAEGKTAECEVTVSAIVRPQIIVTPTEMTLTETKSANVSPSVKFKSRTLDNTEYDITYTYESSAADVASVTSDGAISAKKAGSAEITVKANLPLATSAGIDGELTKKISVSVERDYKFVIGLKDGAETDIYLKEFTEGNVTHKETSQVKVNEASLNGEAIASGWTFKSTDETIATVSAEGVITLASDAVENDKVKVYAEYEKDEAVIKSNEIEFTVRKATIDKELSDELMLDLSVENLTVSDELFGNDFVITDLKDGEKPSVSIWNSDNGTVNKEAVTGLGERKLIIESQKINYRVDAWVVTKVITTARQITDLFIPESGKGVPTVSGYYVLGNDIDASDAVFSDRTWIGGGAGVGLVGTFDGRGHTIDGLNITEGGGVFGSVAPEGTVKNVAFTNVTLNSTSQGVILAFSLNGTLENVFVGVNKMGTTSTNANHVVGLIGQAHGNATLKNVVLVVNSEIVGNEGKCGALAGNNNNGKWENVFVVSTDNLFGGENSGDNMSSSGKSVGKFATVSELLASDYYNEKKTEYPEAIWDIASMTFKSSADFIKAELNALETAKELVVGEAAEIVKNSKIYSITTASDKLAIADGKVTALQKITAAENVTVTVSWGGTSKNVAITAAIPAVTINVEQPLLANDNAPIEIENAVFTGTVSNVKIDETVVADGVSVSNGKLVFATGTVEALMGADKLKSGSHEITLKIGDTDVTVNAVIAWTIKTKDELNAMTNYLSFGTGDYNGNKEAKTSNGYLVLGADINFANSVVAGSWNGSKLKDYFFEGTFDGRGYGISNMSIGNDTNKNTQMGLFGNLGANGTIKNFKLTNVNLTGNCAAIAYLSYGKIENVYIKGTIKSDAGSYGQYSATSLLVGRHMKDSKVNNVIVEAVTAIDTATLVNSSVFGKMGASGVTEADVFSNCFAINAANATLFAYSTTSNLNSFESDANKNLANLAAAWEDTTAAGILEGLKVARPTT